jgi:hypothetical protein
MGFVVSELKEFRYRGASHWLQEQVYVKVAAFKMLLVWTARPNADFGGGNLECAAFRGSDSRRRAFKVPVCVDIRERNYPFGNIQDHLVPMGTILFHLISNYYCMTIWQ